MFLCVPVHDRSIGTHPWIMKGNHVFGKKTYLDRQINCCLSEEGRDITNEVDRSTRGENEL